MPTSSQPSPDRQPGTPGVCTYRLERHTAPMPDTGIGVEMGYASDTEFLAARDAERATWPRDMREAVEAAEADTQRKLLGL